MNVSDAVDTHTKFCVTPGSGSLRLVRPLVAGGRLRSYVRMIPDPADSTVSHGDVYVLQHGGDVEGEGEIVRVMQAIKFRRYPRVLLNRFFSAADVKNPDSVGGVSVGPVLALCVLFFFSYICDSLGWWESCRGISDRLVDP